MGFLEVLSDPHFYIIATDRGRSCGELGVNCSLNGHYGKIALTTWKSRKKFGSLVSLSERLVAMWVNGTWHLASDQGTNLHVVTGISARNSALLKIAQAYSIEKNAGFQRSPGSHTIALASCEGSSDLYRSLAMKL